MYWRTAVIAIQIAFALTFSIALGGGFPVLALFGAWWLAWFLFARFDAWAERSRRQLTRRSPSS